MSYRIQDCRAFMPLAVEVANLQDSDKPSDYRKVEAWLKANPDYQQFATLTLVELFDREVGLGT